MDKCGRWIVWQQPNGGYFLVERVAKSRVKVSRTSSSWSATNNFSPDSSTACCNHCLLQPQCRSEAIREVVAGFEVVIEEEDRLAEEVEVNQSP